jgi:hypothetical protein
MIENAVQVYFVDREMFTEISSADDHGRSILIGLISENQRRGVNIRSLEK